MRRYAAAWPQRTWAVEGANGVGRPLAQRLLAAGEQVVDVPAKLAARVRLFDTGHNRKTDAHDAHAIAMVAVRTTGLRVLTPDPELEALRMLVERRESLSRRRVQTVDRLQALLAELLPGQAKKDLTTGQAKRMLASVRPRDIAGKTRRRIAAEELAELVAVEAKMTKATAELKAIVLARGSHLMDLPGVGPLSPPGSWPTSATSPGSPTATVRVLDRHRTPGRLIRGTDPPPAVPRREPAGQPHDPHRRDQPDPPGHRRRAYYAHKRAEGKRPLEAIRCLKRRISDAIYRQLVADAITVPFCQPVAGRRSMGCGFRGGEVGGSVVGVGPGSG